MTDPLTTTLNRIKDCCPCKEGWLRGLAAAGKTEPDDEPITYEQILDAVGIQDALWCCGVEPKYDNHWRLFAVRCARQIQHLMTDKRSLHALDVAEGYVNGLATDEELAAAEAAAWAASGAASSDAAETAAETAAWAAAEAVDAAWVAAWAASGAAAEAAAGAAAGDATEAAAVAAIRAAQTTAFRQLVTTGALPTQ